ncbi:MAG: hypothetical protein POELPBGB_01338 [Bacteroidia bacterium]|nr:hypothetical protein [Bacteroidia bacterium]
MTEEERTLYDTIKQDPNHSLFPFLFNKNISGEVTPIQGKILKIMPNGVPIIVDSFPFNSLNNQFSETDSFIPMQANKSFQEISNEVALESPFGRDSIFHREEREILKGQIPKL